MAWKLFAALASILLVPAFVTGQELLSKGEGVVRCMQAVPDGLLYFACNDKVSSLDPVSGKIRNSRHLRSYVYDMSVSPDGKSIAVAGFFPQISILDPHLSLLRELDPLDPDDCPSFEKVAFLASGKQVVGASDGGRLYAWDLLSGKITSRLDQIGAVRCLVNAGDDRVCIVDAKGVLSFVSCKGGILSRKKEVRVALSNKVSAADYSPDLNMAALADGPVIRLIDIKHLRGIRELRGHSKAITNLRIITSGAGSLIVTCSLDKTIRIWNTETGRCEKHVTGSEWRSTEYLLKANALFGGDYEGGLFLWRTSGRGSCGIGARSR